MLIEYRIYVDNSVQDVLGILMWPIGTHQHTHPHGVKGLLNYLRDYSLSSGHPQIRQHAAGMLGNPEGRGGAELLLIIMGNRSDTKKSEK